MTKNVFMQLFGPSTRKNNIFDSPVVCEKAGEL